MIYYRALGDDLQVLLKTKHLCLSHQLTHAHTRAHTPSGQDHYPTLSCVVDWDFATCGPLLMDVAFCIVEWCQVGGSIHMPTAKEFIRWMFFPVFFRVLRFVVFCGRRALAMFSSYLSVSILWASILCIVEWYQVEVSIHMPTAREFIVDNFSLQFCSCLFGFLPLFPARSLLLLACERIHCAHTLTNMHTHMYTRKQTHPRTHTRAHLHAAHTRARTQHAYTLTRTHTYTNALGAPHTHTHTHTHTHIHTHNTHTHYTEPTSPFAPSRTLRRRSCGRLFSLCGSGALVFTHAHTHTHQRIHTHTHKNLHTYTYTYTHTHTHTRARAHVHPRYTEPTSPFVPSRTLRRSSCGRRSSLCGCGASVFWSSQSSGTCPLCRRMRRT